MTLIPCGLSRHSIELRQETQYQIVQARLDAAELQQQAQCQQTQALLQNFAALSLHQFSGNISTISSSPTSSREHVSARAHEVDRVCHSIDNHVLASGLKRASQIAFDQAPSSDYSDLSRVFPKSTSVQHRKATRSSPRTNTLRIIWKETRTTETIFGTFAVEYRTRKILPDDSETEIVHESYLCEHRTSFRLTPARWLLRMGFTYGLFGHFASSAAGGPSFGLETTRPVPDDAPIFGLCFWGELDGVRALLAAGEASVRDTDSFGRTPLSVRDDFVFFYLKLIVAVHCCSGDTAVNFDRLTLKIVCGFYMEHQYVQVSN